MVGSRKLKIPHELITGSQESVITLLFILLENFVSHFLLLHLLNHEHKESLLRGQGQNRPVWWLLLSTKSNRENVLKILSPCAECFNKMHMFNYSLCCQNTTLVECTDQMTLGFPSKDHFHFKPTHMLG